MKQTMKPMDEALKNHYAEKSLSDDQMDRLMSLQVDAESQLAADVTEQKPTEAVTKPRSLFERFGHRLSVLLPDFGAYHYAFYATACVWNQ